MGILTKIEAWLSGKKTFILVLSAVVGIIAAIASGTMSITEAIPALWAALTAGAIRSAINKPGV